MVLGVLTGGALLAPIAARLLGVAEVAHVRVSRYADDLYSPSGLARVAVSQLCGSHDAQYRTSEAPPKQSVRGKRVLILDDALASGGTLRAAKAFCVEAGACSVHGVALKIIRGYWDAADETGKRAPAKELRLPIFTPWGTF